VRRSKSHYEPSGKKRLLGEGKKRMQTVGQQKGRHVSVEINASSLLRREEIEMRREKIPLREKERKASRKSEQKKDQFKNHHCRRAPSAVIRGNSKSLRWGDKQRRTTNNWGNKEPKEQQRPRQGVSLAANRRTASYSANKHSYVKRDQEKTTKRGRREYASTND